MVLLVVLGACNEDHRHRTTSPSTGKAAAAVDLKTLRFTPATVEVRVGQSVAWNWVDGTILHDVAFDDGPTSPKQTSGTWERAFLDPGSYDYVCTLHPQMTGKVIVS
ncbi:MAG: cupredoxin domain-containing protein [Actinomycetota bacterium]|nr:cupredoxin domain-containing protein [Actinomycetota bacterium]